MQKRSLSYYYCTNIIVRLMSFSKFFLNTFIEKQNIEINIFVRFIFNFYFILIFIISHIINISFLIFFINEMLMKC